MHGADQSEITTLATGLPCLATEAMHVCANGGLCLSCSGVVSFAMQVLSKRAINDGQAETSVVGCSRHATEAMLTRWGRYVKAEVHYRLLLPGKDPPCFLRTSSDGCCMRRWRQTCITKEMALHAPVCARVLDCCSPFCSTIFQLPSWGICSISCTLSQV